jgi:hypothetical protein
MKQIVTNNKNQLQLSALGMDEAIDSANIKKIFIKYWIFNLYIYFTDKFYDIIKKITHTSSEETITSLSDEDIYYNGLGLPTQLTNEQKNYLLKFINILYNIITIDESYIKRTIKSFIPNNQLDPDKFDAFILNLINLNEGIPKDVYFKIFTLLNIDIIYNKYKVNGIKSIFGRPGNETETLYNEYIIEKEKTCDNSDINLYYVIGGLIFFIILIIIIFIIMYMKKNNNEEEIKNTRVKSKKNKRINE